MFDYFINKMGARGFFAALTALIIFAIGFSHVVVAVLAPPANASEYTLESLLPPGYTLKNAEKLESMTQNNEMFTFSFGLIFPCDKGKASCQYDGEVPKSIFTLIIESTALKAFAGEVAQDYYEQIICPKVYPSGNTLADWKVRGLDNSSWMGQPTFEASSFQLDTASIVSNLIDKGDREAIALNHIHDMFLMSHEKDLDAVRVKMPASDVFALSFFKEVSSQVVSQFGKVCPSS